MICNRFATGSTGSNAPIVFFFRLCGGVLFEWVWVRGLVLCASGKDLKAWFRVPWSAGSSGACARRAALRCESLFEI